ncbi:MAG: murein L,D-transpeptidase [Aquificaceae bacterium]
MIFILLFLFSYAFSEELNRALLLKYKNSLSNYEKVKALYEFSGFHPIWIGVSSFSSFDRIKKLIEGSRYDGLNPEDYDFTVSGDPLKDELTITDHLISLSYDLYYGKIDPARFYRGWSIPKKEDRVLQTLMEIIKENRIEDLFDELRPKYEGYSKLRDHLKEYYKIKEMGGWQRINSKKVLRLGVRDDTVVFLRKRLCITGDLKSCDASDVFDNSLENAVRTFQERHGLKQDGIVGRETFRELNVPIEDRILQIELNLEKFRWLPQKTEDLFILVNIPSFDLYLIKDGKVIIHSPVIVGRFYEKAYRPTPMLYSKIDHITLNPYWYVPRMIAVEDLLPKIKEDPYYVKKEDMKVYLGHKEINPFTVNWNSVTPESFIFRLVQNSGEKNALGRIKFSFPNPFGVYLHDTPYRGLFKFEKRAFSSGCIRVEKAFELAAYLLNTNNEELKSAIESGETKHIKLKRAVPIYVLYFTAFVNNSRLYLWDDLYGYDRIIAKYFKRRKAK